MTGRLRQPSLRPVLFVAHRDEILTQATASFRRIRPEARLGRFDGAEKDERADILFASTRTLGRVGHLRRFAPDAFDYILVDEFHHASAASYRGLGLTATPDRSDGADLLALCRDNLVYHCDPFDGIEAGLLSPFRYMGVPDEVDYAQIPWRSTQFDPEALEAALATEARAQNALDQFHRHRDGPAIGFCCSVRHAEFMAAFFRNRGLRAVAVHSGPGSAPRATSLDQLGRGEIDILFAVDMFNEGVDVPAIGKVMMLRLEQAVAGQMALPPGCSVTYDLRVIEILRDLLRPKSGMEDLEAQYRDFRLRHGRRPRAAEVAGRGFARRASLYNRAISTLDRSAPDIDVLADMIAWSERRGNVAPNTPDTIISVNGLGGKGLMRPPIAPLEPRTSHEEEDEALAVDAARASILYPADRRAS